MKKSIARIFLFVEGHKKRVLLFVSEAMSIERKYRRVAGRMSNDRIRDGLHKSVMIPPHTFAENSMFLVSQGKFMIDG